MIQFARFSAMRRPSHEIRWTKATEERRESFLAWARSPYEYRVRQMCVCTSHGSVENPLIFSAEAGDVAAQGRIAVLCNPALCVPVFLVSARVLSGASTETRKRGTHSFSPPRLPFVGIKERGRCKTFAHADGAIPSREGRILAVLRRYGRDAFIASGFCRGLRILNRK